jgi:cation diffusion facilitator family transporter
MAHYRTLLGAAVGLNTAIIVGEAVAGWQANSLSLLMDSIHNLSDEMALVCIFLAFLLPTALSRTLLLFANLLNSLGLVVLSTVLVWEAIARLLHPIPVAGLVPVWIGLAAAGGNGGVAWLLREPGRHNTAIRLAYVHNLGDVSVSLVPVLAGLLVTLAGRFFFDPVAACGVAVWIIGSTLREMWASHAALLWPEEAVCGHPAKAQVAADGGRLET